MDKLLRPVARDTRPRQTINERERDVLDGVVEANRTLQGSEAKGLTDLVVDISKSTDRAPWCIGATPCALPNSRLQWRRQQRVFGARDMVALHRVMVPVREAVAGVDVLGRERVH